MRLPAATLVAASAWSAAMAAPAPLAVAAAAPPGLLAVNADKAAGPWRWNSPQALHSGQAALPNLQKLQESLQFQQAPVSDPGPLDSVSNCGVDGDIFTYKSMTLSPDPPHRGESLLVKLLGSLSEPVVKGATAHVNVKLGFIQIYDATYDLCEQVVNVGLECPIPEGPVMFEESFDIPREIPPGRYKVHIDVNAVDGRHIGCIQAQFRM